MADSADVIRLASMARISISPDETDSFVKEFESILEYVSLLEKIDFDESEELQLPIKNVFREDNEPHEERLHSEKIIEQFPEREGDLLVVKQIISHD